MTREYSLQNFCDRYVKEYTNHIRKLGLNMGNAFRFNRQTTRSILFLSILMVISSFMGCALYDLEVFQQTAEETSRAGTPIMVESSADQITLEWDPPSSEVVKYIISFRIHGQDEWVPLGEIMAVPAPEYTIQYATLGDGDYDFAITAENNTGVKSGLHMSLDLTAQPPTGWYLRWRK
jgi:hypothetical protein